MSKTESSPLALDSLLERLILPLDTEFRQDLVSSNPLLCFEGMPRFLEILPEHVMPAAREVIRACEIRKAQLEEVLQKLEKPELESFCCSWPHFGGVLENLSLATARVMGLVSHLCSVAYSHELNDAKEEAQNLFVEFELGLGQSPQIFAALECALGIKPVKRAARAEHELAVKDRMSQASRRALQWRYLAAKHSGVGLANELKKQFSEHQTRIAVLESQFAKNILESTKTFHYETANAHEVAGLPEAILRMACSSNPKEGPWKFGLDGPTRLAIADEARHRELRRWARESSLKIASEGEFDNSAIMLEIVKLRHECAQLLGYEDYAHQSLAQKVARSPLAVKNFSDSIVQRAVEKCRAEIDELRKIAHEFGIQAEKMEMYDVPFLFERLREKKFNYSAEELRPYFPVPKVLDGLRRLTEKYFGLTFTEASSVELFKRANGSPQSVLENTPKWHEDVRFFHVEDLHTGERLASIYMDLYARTGLKQPGAWAGEIWPRHRRSRSGVSEVVLPLGLIVCNGTVPDGATPSLMSVSEVETLLHEFGHLMQFMCARVDIPSVAGFAGVEWDAVEVASQFMENWLYEPEGMSLLSSHHETGETLPSELFEKFVASRAHGRGWQLCRQLKFGIFDLELFSTTKVLSARQIFELSQKVHDQVLPIQEHLPDTSPCSFGHIFSGAYAAGYYSYLWSEVWSADAFAALIEARDALGDQAMQETGLRYRNSFLSVGGGQDPLNAFKAFRGREPRPDALFRQIGF